MKTKILVGALVLVLIAGALFVKLRFFPGVKEDYFSMDQRALRQAPDGLVVIRPTHFRFLPHGDSLEVSIDQPNGRSQRMMGRNVPLNVVFARAYGQAVSRVVLPAGLPRGNFDFLVTVSGDPEAAFQAALRRKLGYVAKTETRETAALAVKIVNPALPGLTVSGADEREGADYNDVRIKFRHLPLLMVLDARGTLLAEGLERVLNIPVVDKTGLTNRYDYSLGWNPQVQRQLANPATARAAVDKILGGWGLGLEPDTASLEMLVVKKAE